MDESFSQDSDFLVDTPEAYLPDLTLLGIEQVQPGVCVDSYENRKLLRKHKYTWTAVFDREGKQTPFIQAITSEMSKMRSLQALEDKRVILADPRDPNSDYETGVDLVLIPDASVWAPAWVLAATRRWNEVARVREAGNEKYRPSLAGPPGRCRAKLSNGLRCQYWHGGRVDEDGICKMHLGKLFNVETNSGERARNRINAALEAAAMKLEELMDTATSEQVALHAANSLLDRGGIRGGIEIDQTVTEARPARELVAERIEKLKKAQLELEEKRRALEDADTIDAEVVEDDGTK